MCGPQIRASRLGSLDRAAPGYRSRTRSHLVRCCVNSLYMCNCSMHFPSLWNWRFITVIIKRLSFYLTSNRLKPQSVSSDVARLRDPVDTTPDLYDWFVFFFLFLSYRAKIGIVFPIRSQPFPFTSFPIHYSLVMLPFNAIQNVSGGKLILCEVIIPVILSKKVYMYMCPIPNGFRDTAISLYSTLYTVQTSNTPCPHTSFKVHSCWRWNFRKCIKLGKLYQLCHLNNKYRY
jgi:hypothetical protein